MSIQSDNDYKPEFEIMDMYMNFSAELLRIPLLAIGGFGAIMLIKLKEESIRIFSEQMIQIWNEGHGKWEQTVGDD